MTLIELQKILGDRITTTLRNDLTPEQRQIENEQTKLIVGVGKQMINNGDLVLRAEKLFAQNHSLEESEIIKMIKG